jgi:hypothetical protein
MDVFVTQLQEMRSHGNHANKKVTTQSRCRRFRPFDGRASSVSTVPCGMARVTIRLQLAPCLFSASAVSKEQTASRLVGTPNGWTRHAQTAQTLPLARREPGVEVCVTRTTDVAADRRPRNGESERSGCGWSIASGRGGGSIDSGTRGG